MERKTLTDAENEKLLNAIAPIVFERGPSHTTMDLVAQQLSISKRTLYEVFESKDQMLREVLDHFFTIHKLKVESLMRSASNVMEALAKFLVFHKNMMVDKVGVDFFRDMDSSYRSLRDHYETKSQDWSRYMVIAIRLGMRQKVFRADCIPEMIVKMLGIQMEALKRMEEAFPPEISLAEVYNYIGLGFLRGIASEKGMKILDSLYENKTDF